MLSPTNFYNCAAPTIWTGLILGLTPILPTKQRGTSELIISKPLSCIPLAYMVAYTAILVLAQNSTKTISPSYDSDSVSKVTSIISNVLATITTYTIYFGSFKNVAKVKEIFKGLADTDSSLQQLDQKILYKNKIWYQIVVLIPLQLVQILLLTIQIWDAPREHLPASTFWMDLMVVFPAVIQNFMESQFILMTIAIYERFDLINKQLQNLDSSIKTTPSLTTLKRLNRLNNIHDKVCDISALLDEAYGGRMFASSILQFELIVTSLFASFSNYSKAPTNSLLSFGFGLLKALELLRKVAACQVTQNQATFAKTVVHKLLLLDSSTEIKKMLMEFSQQLMHRRVKFTANGLFSVDATLLFTVVSTVATYGIILFQFNQSPETPTCYITIGNSSSYKSL